MKGKTISVDTSYSQADQLVDITIKCSPDMARIALDLALYQINQTLPPERPRADQIEQYQPFGTTGEF